MPTIVHIGPYRFFFYASDMYEPMHVLCMSSATPHLRSSGLLQHSLGFGRSELVKLESLVVEHRDALMEA